MARVSDINVNPDLIKERAKATFNPEILTNILDGGEIMTKRRRFLEREVLKDDMIRNEKDSSFMTREEAYANAIKKSALYVNKLKELGCLNREDNAFVRNVIFPNEPTPLSLAISMFPHVIQYQGTEEQLAKWLDKARRLEVVGTYAQTELGHGTHLRGLETTATYDPKTQEFILNSPTVTSAKFWPGGLGKTCNHAVVMANLIVGGVQHGVHPFIAQIRDLATHVPMPGVTLGDIGTKFGYETMDNGFMRLNNVRIPRENMLMKYQEVTKDGRYVKKTDQNKLVYGAMLATRVMIPVDPSSRCLAEAVTIAIRYSCVRHQSEINPGEPEPAVLEYQTQQMKLFPVLAMAYAFTFTSTKFMYEYFDKFERIQNGEFENLPELHALSASLKAYVSSAAMRQIEQCRLACGGHGYMKASGFYKIYTVQTPACTYEGENTVMLLQTARYLTKMFKQAQEGKRSSGSTAYFSSTFNSLKNNTDILNVEFLITALKLRAFKSVERAVNSMAKLMASGKTFHDTWNQCGVVLTKASEDHTKYYIAASFLDSIRGIKDRNLYPVLLNLFHLHVLHEIYSDSTGFLRDGILSGEQVSRAQDEMLECFDKLRPNAVTLVDSFDFCDRHLGSVLGRYDGNVYENLLKWAKSSPLNKTEVHESFKYMQQLRASKL